MKRFIIALLLCLVSLGWTEWAAAVDCPASSYTLSSQAAVDAVPADCDRVADSLLVEGSDITNLDGLANITSVGGDLRIQVNPALTNLNGLANITSVGGDLNIGENGALTNLDGLANITSVGDLFIGNNAALTNLNGLANITSVARFLAINNNAALTNLDGLANITSVGDGMFITRNYLLTNLDGLANITSLGGSLFIENNNALTNLEGLVNMTSVGGLSIAVNPLLTNLNALANITSVGYLSITSNAALTNLDGLANITSVARFLVINNNAALTNLDGLANITSVGEFLQIFSNAALTNCQGIALLLGWPNGPPDDSVGGEITIQSNSTGCNSVEQVLASADTDGDGVDDATDNCPNVENADQLDADSDGQGDSCDFIPEDPAYGSCEGPYCLSINGSRYFYFALSDEYELFEFPAYPEGYQVKDKGGMVFSTFYVSNQDGEHYITFNLPAEELTAALQPSGKGLNLRKDDDPPTSFPQNLMFYWGHKNARTIGSIDLNLLTHFSVNQGLTVQDIVQVNDAIEIYLPAVNDNVCRSTDFTGAFQNIIRGGQIKLVSGSDLRLAHDMNVVDLSSPFGGTAHDNVLNLCSSDVSVGALDLKLVAVDGRGGHRPFDLKLYVNPERSSQGGHLQLRMWDEDEDSVPFWADAFPLDSSEQYDTDGDGVGDNGDNCTSVANTSQTNTDNDGLGNACDTDDDNDGVNDADDAWALDPAASKDTDGDGMPDEWNPGKTQADSTSNPMLVLDNDDDNDGVNDEGEVSHTSTLACQPSSNEEHASDGLRYTKSGLNNVGQNKTVTVRCPVDLDGETAGYKYTYDIQLTAEGINDSAAGRLKCALAEVASSNRTNKQIQVRSRKITGNSKESLSWLGVEKLAVDEASAFTLECKVPPKVGLANITVTKKQ